MQTPINNPPPKIPLASNPPPHWSDWCYRRRWLGLLLLGLLAIAAASPFTIQYMQTFGTIASLQANATPNSLISTFYPHYHVQGYYAAGDGGGGEYTVVANVTSTNAYGGKIASRVSGFSFVLQDSNPNIRQFGARMNNTDDTTFINAGLTYVSGIGGGSLLVPTGTTRADGQINLQDKIVLKGYAGASIINQQNATVTDAYIYGTGSQSALPALASDVALGATTIVFATPHGMSAGDVYVLWNSTDYSFSLNRSYYRAGECYKVIGVNVDGVTVTNSSPSMAAYTAGVNIELYKKTFIHTKVQDLKIMVKTGVSKSGIKIVHGTGLLVDNVDIGGSQLAQVDIDRSYNVSINHVTANDYNANSGNNYGVQLNSVHIGSVSDVKVWGPRHGISCGGYGLAGSIPNRWIKFEDVHTEAYGSAGNTGIDAHGNAEYVEWHNCSSPSGIDMGGDHMKVVGGSFGNFNDNHEALLIAETTGMDFEINGVSLYANQSLLTTVGLGYVLVESCMTKENQIMRVNNMKIDLGPYTGNAASTYGLMFEASASAPTQKYGIEVNNLSVTSSYTNNIGTNFVHIYGLNFAPGDSTGFQSAKLNGGTFVNCGVRVKENIQNLELKNFSVINAVGDAVLSVVVSSPSFTDQKWTLDTVYNIGSQGTINLAANTNATLFVSNVRSFNCANHLNASSSLDSSIYITGFNDVVGFNNYFGDLRASPTQLRSWGLESINNLRWNNNIKMGSVTAVNETSITNLITDLAPQSDSTFMYYDKAYKTFGIGTANQTYGAPFWIRRDTNTLVQLNLQNLNNASSSAAGLAVFSSSSSAVFGAANTGYTPITALADSGFFLLNSTASKGVHYGATAGQTWDFYAGTTTLGLQLATTNGSLAGNLSANGGVFTNTLTINGYSVPSSARTNKTAYAAGTAYTMTASQALLDFGTTDPSITIPVTGTYLLLASANLKYNAATYVANQTATIKLRVTSGTPADVANATRTITMRTITTITDDAGIVTIPATLYAATAGDIIQVFGAVSATPSAGSVDADSAEIVALQQF